MRPSEKSSTAESLADAFSRETGYALRIRRVGEAAVLVPERETVDRYGRFGIVVGPADEPTPQTWAVSWCYGDGVELVLWPGAQLAELDAVLRRAI